MISRYLFKLLFPNLFTYIEKTELVASSHYYWNGEEWRLYPYDVRLVLHRDRAFNSPFNKPGWQPLAPAISAEGHKTLREFEILVRRVSGNKSFIVE